jgi:hypothetical protein
MRKPSLAAICVVAAVALAGCSGSTAGTASPGAATTGVSVAPATYATAADLAEKVSSATQDKGSARMTFDMGVAGQAITGTGAFAGKGADTKLQMSMNAGGQGGIEMVLLDRNIYLKVPGSPGGKPWMRSSLDGAFGKQFGGLGDQADPSKQFDQLKTAGTLSGATPDTVDGTPATKYTLTLDAAKLAAAGTPEQQATNKALVEQGVKTIDMQIWVGDDNLPLRVSTSTPVQGQTTTIDIHYSDWGKPVDIAAPPADETADAPN